MKRAQRFKFLAIVFIVYILAAFCWWSTLLYKRTVELYTLKFSDLTEGSSGYQELAHALNQQKTMIVSEGVLLGFSFLGLIVLFWYSYKKSVLSTEKENDFLLSTTHELKSPLSSIRLALETFIKRDLTKEQLNRLASNSLKESNRLEYLVNNMLIANRIEGHFQLNKNSVDIVELTRSVKQRLKVQYPDREILINGPEILQITLDEQGITSVIRNLIENAIKYSPLSSIVEVNIQLKKNKLVYDVKDQGIGIDKREKEKIADKFYRVEAEKTRSYKGTGLGLYIVKEIVKMHEGTMQVIDNEPKGSVFRIIIPR